MIAANSRPHGWQPARPAAAANTTPRISETSNLSHSFRVDVSAKGQKQVALLAKDKVAVEQLYAATLYQNNQPQPLMMRLRVQNREADGLGLALPAGTAAVFESVGGQRLLVGEAVIGDKAKDERVDYYIAEPSCSFDVVHDRDRRANSDVAGTLTMLAFEPKSRCGFPLR